MISLHTNDPAAPGRCPSLKPTRTGRRRRSLAIIGVGAFGEFCIQHLRRFFDVHLCDTGRNLEEICERHGVRSVDLRTAAEQDIVLLAVPFGQLRATAKAIAPHLRPGSLVVDVCSIKSKPLSVLAEELPATADIVGTHPLFGPQSGRSGISGLRIAVCPARGRRGRLVARFLRDELKLQVVHTTAEQHDRQMAFVQGMTHLIARIMGAMDMPSLDHTTTAFSHLEAMADLLRRDSDELFRTIISDNPYAEDMVGAFVRATRDVLQPLSYPSNADALS